MDTAKIKTLQQIVDAIGEIQQALGDNSLTQSQRTAIENTLVELREIQNDIIISSEQGLIDALANKNNELSDLADEISQASANLDGLANTIKKVGDAVGTLVSITAAAVSAGLL